MTYANASVAKASVSKASVLLIATLLAGCSATGLGETGGGLGAQSAGAHSDVDGSKARQKTPDQQHNKAAGEQQGQESLHGQKYMSNQVLRSLGELTADNSATRYPVIADAPAQKRRLLTEQERSQIEEELRSLSQ
ncbi:MAG: hypothetical protein OIF56_01430 [Cohaesibacter sp.]|nr:hypothetical protein [Cohaesibacter sp.]